MEYTCAPNTLIKKQSRNLQMGAFAFRPFSDTTHPPPKEDHYSDVSSCGLML